jgi:hypothetical protein
MREKLIASAAGAAVLFGAATGFAAADKPDFTDGFICPVLGGQAGEHGKAVVIEQPPGGFYTVIGPEVHVPVHATNGDGAGSPAGPFVSPGEDGYSPIWATP